MSGYYEVSDEEKKIWSLENKIFSEADQTLNVWREAKLSYTTMSVLRKKRGQPLIGLGWTDAHEASFRTCDVVMTRVESIVEEAKSRFRQLALDPVSNDVAILGTGSDLRVSFVPGSGDDWSLVAGNDAGGQYMYRSTLWKQGQEAVPVGVGAAPLVIGGLTIPPVLVGIAVVCVTVVALSAMYTAYSTIGGYIVRLMATDAQKFYQDCRASGSTDADCVAAVSSTRDAVVAEIEADTLRREQDPQSKMWTAVMWGSIAVGVLGVGYIAWRFVPRRSTEPGLVLAPR